jgi:hypothetical protein
MEQEVCQLLLAALCRKFDLKWQEVAGNSSKAANIVKCELKNQTQTGHSKNQKKW